nr:MAG TPA: hypothetical protein [Caudoviricetes sp.]
MEESKYEVKVSKYILVSTPLATAKYFDIDLPDDVVEKIIELIDPYLFDRSTDTLSLNMKIKRK